MRLDYVSAGTNLRWHILNGTLVRVWAIGYAEPDFESKIDSMGVEIPTTRMRCVVPPTKKGSYRMIDADFVVDDDAVLRATHRGAWWGP